MQQSTVSTVLDLQELMRSIAQLHAAIDRHTCALCNEYGADHSLTLRAEAAGAALHRLLWGVERQMREP